MNKYWMFRWIVEYHIHILQDFLALHETSPILHSQISSFNSSVSTSSTCYTFDAQFTNLFSSTHTKRFAKHLVKQGVVNLATQGSLYMEDNPLASLFSSTMVDSFNLPSELQDQGELQTK